MTTPFSTTIEAERYLEALAESLSVSESRYEQAEKSYESLGGWLCRPASTVRPFGPQVYVQGSFALGTTIRPTTEAEDYDVDSVCEFHSLTALKLTQRELKRRIGVEIEAYRVSQNMTNKLREGRRCWTLNYADGAQFHMDVVPAVPAGYRQRVLLEEAGFSTDLAATAIGITDNERYNYDVLSEDWPRSNPLGYIEWFKKRMAVRFQEERQRLAEAAMASVDSIPEYRVRTPLQSAIMILKRHRDMRSGVAKCDRPISIIITTLAAHAYQSEAKIGYALSSILARMDDFIEHDGRTYTIRNPSDPLENFADKWSEYPERAAAFFDWLKQAQQDFAYLAGQTDRQRIVEVAKNAAGDAAVRRIDEGFRAGANGPRVASVAPLGALAFPNEPRVPTSPKGFA
jgi:hypothetical protein